VLRTLETVPGLEDHSGRLQFPGQIAVTWDKTIGGAGGTPIIDDRVSGLIFGLDFDNDTAYFSMKPYIKEGGRVPGKDEVLVADGFARQFGLKRGDPIIIYGGNSASSRSLRATISGIISLPVTQMGQKAVFLRLSEAQEMYSQPGEVQEILLKFKKGTNLTADVEKTAAALTQAGFPDMEVKAWNTIGVISMFLDFASTAYNIMALIFFILGTTVIVNTTMMVIYERMREIGTLRAMGMTGREMIRLFFMEAFFISAAAAFLGVAIGVGLTLPLSVSGFDLGQLADVSQMNISISNIIYPQINLYSTLFVFVYSVTVASLISFIPTRRAAKIEPVEALRSI
jgi:putative ABC transport system permease protein